MLASASPIAFLPSTDLDRSRRFFADRLGLAVEDVTPFACVVRVATTMLRVTKVDAGVYVSAVDPRGMPASGDAATQLIAALKAAIGG